MRSHLRAECQGTVAAAPRYLVDEHAGEEKVTGPMTYVQVAKLYL